VGDRLLQPMSGAAIAHAADEPEWFEMPVVRDSESQRVRPKYPIPSPALLVYEGDRVYVGQRGAQELLVPTDAADVRRLSLSEVLELNDRHPFIALQGSAVPDRRVRLGDLVSRFTHMLGIRECEPCRQRKNRLNRIVIWGWWRT
jgi:hypothetical protein